MLVSTVSLLPPEGNGFELRNLSNQLPSTILALINYTFLKGKEPQQLTFHKSNKKKILTSDQFLIWGTRITLGCKNEGLGDLATGFTKSSEKTRKINVNITGIWMKTLLAEFSMPRPPHLCNEGNNTQQIWVQLWWGWERGQRSWEAT